MTALRVAHYLGGPPLGPDAPLIPLGDTCGDCGHPWWAHEERRQDDMRREPCIGSGCKCRREHVPTTNGRR